MVSQLKPFAALYRRVHDADPALAEAFAGVGERVKESARELILGESGPQTPEEAASIPLKEIQDTNGRTLYLVLPPEVDNTLTSDEAAKIEEGFLEKLERSRTAAGIQSFARNLATSAIRGTLARETPQDDSNH